MRVRAVVEFDVNIDDWVGTVRLRDIEDELKCNLEAEHYGIAEYDSCTVIELTEIN